MSDQAINGKNGIYFKALDQKSRERGPGHLLGKILDIAYRYSPLTPRKAL